MAYAYTIQSYALAIHFPEGTQPVKQDALKKANNALNQVKAASSGGLGAQGAHGMISAR
jgi:hypothetical protein